MASYARSGARPPFTGGAVLLGAGPAPQLALRILDGLRRELGRTPTGADIRATMQRLDAARSELAIAANAADRGASK